MINAFLTFMVVGAILMIYGKEWGGLAILLFNGFLLIATLVEDKSKK